MNNIFKWSEIVSIILCLCFLPIRARTFTIGYLTGSERLPGNSDYTRPGLTISGAISLAVDEINKYTPLVGGHELNFTVSETYGDEEMSIYQVAVLWTQKVSVYIGPQETCVHEAKMASGFNLPMISYFCARRETSDKSQFPTFARTRPPDTQISRFVASLLLTFHWMKVAFLYSDNQEGRFKDVSRTIVSTLDEAEIQIRYLGTWSYTYHHGYGENPFDALVTDSYQETRIYVILGYYFEHLGLMMSLQRKGLLDTGDYFVLGVDIEQYETQDPTRYFKGLLLDEIEKNAEKAFQSYLGIVASPPNNTDDFATKVNEYMQQPPFNFPNPIRSFGGIKKVPAEGAYLYDAVNMYARALNESLLNGENPFDGRGLMKYITERSYLSAMGYFVYMDENGDAEGNYTLIARKEIPGSPGNYGLFPVAVFQIVQNRSNIQDLAFFSDIEWISGSPPQDEPVCGFHGEKCVMWKLAIFIFGAMISLLLLVFLVSYKHWAYEQELDSLLWKIDYKDIEINEFTPTANQPKSSKNVHPLIRTSQVSLSSNVEGDFRYSSIYTTVGIYKGRLLAVKRLRKKNIDITRKMKKELKVMRDLRHDNLNPFIGACIDQPNICIITEYCSRGSLKDVLENEAVKLDNMFNASLIGDSMRGMAYLHDSALRSHGNLKSSNCLVDSRWVVKITDFGLHELKFGADSEQEDSLDFERQCEKLLWTSPELLRNPIAPPGGTQKGDIYSFGILLYEIIGRKGPYGQINMTPSEIIKKVLGGDRRFLFRPNVAKLQASFDCVVECMQECWSEDPENRPDFKCIRTKLRPMRRGMKPHIFDNMLAMMEKYADNLEALVDERTDQLIEEKKKTDALLYEMLPRYVADQLKKGNKVEAESFDSVTIYFSDIVGFTTMSAQSSPLEVVDFLNDLYTCFDSIIENYDIYKVETIGDAYMVVSGLPVKNGDNHASEIASMALHLLQDVQKFKIRHRPSDTLMLRVGIHSGAVCAGVVGQKMPRYCLFGDTVNTASRMESSGLPLRIHCSESFKLLLDKLGGYQVEDRGFISIKGKGEMHTYWLTGQDVSRKKGTLASKPEQAIDVPKFATRSSMKQSNKLADSNRVTTQESPKKLRFAPGSSLAVCDKNINPQNIVQFCNSLNDSVFQNENSSLLAFSRWCLISKRNSCPCLMDNCSFCCRTKYANAEKNIFPPINKSDLVVPELHSFHRRWERVEKLASFVSRLEENYVVVYDKLSNKAFNISHSESEPFLSGLHIKLSEEIK